MKHRLDTSLYVHKLPEASDGRGGYCVSIMGWQWRGEEIEEEEERKKRKEKKRKEKIGCFV